MPDNPFGFRLLRVASGSLALAVLLSSSACTGSARAPPLSSGRYTFQHRFAEHPTIPGAPLVAVIDGTHIVLTNESDAAELPKGVVAEGTLMWHSASKQWIIGHEPSDAQAEEVGGCSDGPAVVDVQNMVYWTC
jgi:hypothetical protein